MLQIPQHQQCDLHVGTFSMGITGIETCQVSAHYGVQDNQRPSRHIPASSGYFKNSFFTRTIALGIPFQPLWGMLPVWYLSNPILAPCHSNQFRACRMQVNPSDFLCCAGGDFVCPGTCKVARLVRQDRRIENAFDTTFLNSSDFPIMPFFAFLKLQSPHYNSQEWLTAHKALYV